MRKPRLLGLVLAGGLSRRMGRDKGSLPCGGISLRARAVELLSAAASAVYVSCRREQAAVLEPGTKAVFDVSADLGPAGGLISAHRLKPRAAWLVLACDMPLATPAAVKRLVAARDPERPATVFTDKAGEIEPLFSIWEPAALAALERAAAEGEQSPRWVLEGLDCLRVEPPDWSVLRNVNTPEDYERVRGDAAHGS